MYKQTFLKSMSLSSDHGFWSGEVAYIHVSVIQCQHLIFIEFVLDNLVRNSDCKCYFSWQYTDKSGLVSQS